MSIDVMQGSPSGRPGWSELTVGIIVLAIVGFGVGSQIHRFGLDPMPYGLVLAGWSGLSCMAGFGAAWMVRRRPLTAFGVAATTRRWLLLGVGAGVLTFVAKGLVVMAFTALTGIFVPLGEELLFRGLVTTVLLRYGALVGVGGGALLFALLHGISIVFPVAVLQGLVAGELYRRSGSLWPGVIVHVIYNLPTVPVLVLTGGA